MRQILAALVVAFCIAVCGCGGTKLGNFLTRADRWTVTEHIDIDGDGRLETVIYHYQRFADGSIEMWEEVIG